MVTQRSGGRSVATGRLVQVVLTVVVGLVLAWSEAGVALAKELTTAELRAVQAKIKSSDSLSVDFVQTKYSGLRGKSTRRNGRAQFTKPNLFRWMLETPSREYKIFDGKSFYDYSPDAQSARRYSATGPQGEELRQIIDLVLNFDALLKRYDLIRAAEDGSEVQIFLKPKSESSELIAVELHLDMAQEYVSFLKMTLRNKNSLTHEFKNPSRLPVQGTAFALPIGTKVSEGV